MMNRRTRLCVALLLAAGLLAAPTQAPASKIDTHIWVGQQVINDLEDDGKITIKISGRFVTLPVPENVKNAILANRNAYLLGNIGPDAIPDVVVGQGLVHPGSETGWKTNDWLNFLLAKSQGNPLGTAFTYGYLGHASADMFAHTYVNQYAGDIFDLTDESLVEQRHAALEGFISRFNPPFLNAAGQNLGGPWTLVQPSTELANFLRDTLIYDDQAAAQNANGAYGKHLAAYRLYRNVIQEASESGIWREIDIAVLQIIAYYFEIELSSQEAGLIIDFMNNEVIPRVQSMQNLTQDQVNRLNAAADRLDAAHFAALNDALRRVISLNSTIAQKLAQRLEAESQICHWVTRTACKVICISQPWPLNDLCNNTCNTINELQCDVTSAAADLVRQIDAELNGTGGLHDQLLQAAKRIHDEAVVAKNKSLAIAQALFDLQQIVGSNTSPVKALLTNWVKDLDVAMAEYVKAAASTMINTMNPASKNLEHKAITPMVDWWDCYHLVIAGVPSPVGTGRCGFRGDVERTWAALQNIANTLEDVALLAPTRVAGLPSPSEIRARVDGLKKDAIKKLEDAAINELIDLLPQQVQDLIAVLSEDMTDERLRYYFTKPETSIPGKRLLMIRDIDERVRREMRLTGSNTFDPERFPIVYNAVVLAKLALLDNAGLALLAQEAGVPLAQDGTPLFAGTANIMANAFASIDGNHQWMPVAPPRPNATGTNYERVDLPGYPSPGGYAAQAGFVPWKQEARTALFRSLFIGPLSPGVESPNEIGMPVLLAANYPYRPCQANPFPNDEQDQACAATTPPPSLAFAATFNADTDGDGTIDTITAGPTSLEIFHSGTGLTTQYPMGPASYTVIKSANTDGRPGSEVLVLRGNALIVIDDARRVTRSYDLGSPYTVHFTADTDGLPGEEIVASTGAGKIVIVNDALGFQHAYDINVATPGWVLSAELFGYAEGNGLPGAELVVRRNDNQLLVIDDARGAVSTYNIGVPFQIHALADTDGQPGDEIVIARSDNMVQIIHVATGVIRSYNIGQPYQINGVTDTNAVAGKEVIVSTADFRILIIDDRTGAVRPYAINGPFSVQAIADLDGVPGAEVCFFSSMTGVPTYTMIVDRLGRRTLSADQTRCGAPVPDTKPIAAIAALPAISFIKQPVRLDASGSFDPEGYPLTYKWTFGDGGTATLSTPVTSHAYSQLGTYTVTLVVNDGVLDSVPASATVVVKDAGWLVPILELLLDD